MLIMIVDPWIVHPLTHEFFVIITFLSTHIMPAIYRGLAGLSSAHLCMTAKIQRVFHIFGAEACLLVPFSLMGLELKLLFSYLLRMLLVLPSFGRT